MRHATALAAEVLHLGGVPPPCIRGIDHVPGTEWPAPPNCFAVTGNA
jgi:hypothetical protein